MSDENLGVPVYSHKNLGIPIYLDTETLLDLMASLDDGFSSGSKTSFSEALGSDSSKSKEGIIGFGLRLFSLRGKISKNEANSSSQGATKEYEKYHTYGSMMNILINELKNHNRLVDLSETIKEFGDLNISDFVLLEGKLKPNPLADYFKKMSNVLDFAYNLGDFNENEDNVDDEKKKAIMKVIEKMADELEDENYQKYLVEIKDNNFSLLMYLFDSYIRDRSGVELPLGEYKILGKIVRKVKEDEETLDWKDGTTFSSINLDIISDLNRSLSGVNFFNLPNIESTAINGNIIHIVPIAIFI